MNKPSSKKSIIIIVIVVVIAAVGYFYYQGSAPASSGSLLSSSTGPEQSAIGVQVLSLLNQIQLLHIDTALFTDPGYLTLRDYSVQIPPQPVGRPNPFAPLPGVPASK